MVAVIIPTMRLAPLLLSTMCTWNDRCASPIMHGDRGDRFARGNGLRSHNVEFKNGDWTCEECGASPVFAKKTHCFRCGAPRPDGAGHSSGSSSPRSFDRKVNLHIQNQRHSHNHDHNNGPSFKQGDWTCPECGASPVFAARTECFRCGAPRPADGGVPAQPEFRENWEGTRCFVENLSYETDWQMLKDAFANENYPIVYASVSEDRQTGRSKGCGIVQFETQHAAQHAIDEMTGFELDGRRINVRPDYQERSKRKPMTAKGVAAAQDEWKNKEWTRVAGTDDSLSDVDDGEVLKMLVARDAARDQRDFNTADGVLDELADMGVSLDDARRQRVWWVGRRADGRQVGGRGAAASRGRRDWHRGGDEPRGY